MALPPKGNWAAPTPRWRIGGFDSATSISLHHLLCILLLRRGRLVQAPPAMCPAASRCQAHAHPTGTEHPHTRHVVRTSKNRKPDTGRSQLARRALLLHMALPDPLLRACTLQLLGPSPAAPPRPPGPAPPEEAASPAAAAAPVEAAAAVGEQAPRPPSAVARAAPAPRLSSGDPVKPCRSTLAGEAKTDAPPAAAAVTP